MSRSRQSKFLSKTVRCCQSSAWQSNCSAYPNYSCARAGVPVAEISRLIAANACCAFPIFSYRVASTRSCTSEVNKNFRTVKSYWYKRGNHTPAPLPIVRSTRGHRDKLFPRFRRQLKCHWSVTSFQPRKLLRFFVHPRRSRRMFQEFSSQRRCFVVRVWVPNGI